MSGKVHFIMELAECRVDVSCLYESTKSYCKDYLISDRADPDYSKNDGDAPARIYAATDQEDIDHERELTDAYDLAHDGAVHNWSDAYLETLALYRKIAEQMIQFDVILMHGSCISVDGRGYLFTGPSGTGKSTHARLWRELLSGSHDIVAINDDKPLIRFFDDRIAVYGTPWDGKHRLSTNAITQLAAVGKIVPDDFDRTEQMKESDKWPLLLGQCFRPESRESLGRMLKLMERMKREIPFFDIHCGIRPESAECAWEAMRGV